MSIESRAANRAGLARFRPLAARSNSKNNPNINPNSKTNGSSTQNSINGPKDKNNITNLPDGWYFNETREQDFWKDIERGQVPQTQESDFKAQMLKKNDQITDLQDTSSKIRSLVDQFDEIDQDTLMILLQIYDDGYGAIEDLDQQMIMSDSKTHVLDFMTQLKNLSDSQTFLMENLRFFFSTLQLHSSNGESENVSGEELPDLDDTFEQLSSYLREYAEKSERAACLHNDINDFLFKQISNYKRVVLMRDEEIRKLQKTMNDVHAISQARKNKKKADPDKSTDSIKVDTSQKEQLDNQIRINQELQQQIELLKAALKEGDFQNASLSATISDPLFDPVQSNKNLLLKDNDINTMKVNFEAKMSSNKATIEQLLKQIEHLKKLLCDQEIKYDELAFKYKDLEKQRDELNESLQKQSKLLEIEQKRNENKPEPIQEDLIDRQELYEAEMRHQNEIRELNENHRNELIKATEEARENFIKERQKLIESIESGDTKSLIESISTECEMKIQKQKEEYERKEKGIVQIWAGKVALLTRQYENRIKAMSASHEVDLLMAKDSVRYEVQKAELDIEEKYNLQLLEMGRERKEKYEQFNKQLDKMAADLEVQKEENKMLIAQIKVYDKDFEIEKPETPPATENNENNNEIQKVESFKENETFILSEKEKLMEKYAMKMKIMKQEMDDQMNWALDKQKNYYEREISRVMIQHQKEMRERLMQLQELIAQSHIESTHTSAKNTTRSSGRISAKTSKIKLVNSTQSSMPVIKEEENEETATNTTSNSTDEPETKAINNINNNNVEEEIIENHEEEDVEEDSGDEKMLNIMREISQAFFNMNSQFEKIDEIEQEPTMTVKEANERTKVLTDRLIQLSSENQELKSSQVFTESSETIIQKLRERLSFMESLQSGDMQSAIAKMNQMEAHYKHELEIKDQMLLNFQTLNDVFTKMGQNKAEDTEMSEIDFDQITNKNDQLIKLPPGEINSAPIEYTTLKKPLESNVSSTARKKPMRMHSNQLTQAYSRIDLAVSDVIHSYESLLSPLQFKPTAFLIDEELHQILLNELVPQHVENERVLVTKVIDEVFERLPLHKTNEALSSHPNTAKSILDRDQESEICKTVSNRSLTIVSQSVSPRQKSLIPDEKHYSFVVIQSFFIPPMICTRKKKKQTKPKLTPKQNPTETEKTNETEQPDSTPAPETTPSTNIANEEEDNNKDDDYDVDDYITLYVSDSSLNYYEVKNRKVPLQTAIFADLDLLYSKATKKPVISKINYSSYSKQEKTTKSKPKPKPKPTENQTEQTKPNEGEPEKQPEQQSNQDPKFISEDDPVPNSPTSERLNQNEEEEEEPIVLFKPAIDNEVLIDIPYILYTNDSLTDEVKAHILDLEKEVSELKGRPLPTQVVNTYVPREVNPDHRQITLQLYMPLTGEESKKLRAERKKRLSKETSPVRHKPTEATNEEETKFDGKKVKLSFSDYKKEDEKNDQTNISNNTSNHSVKFDDSNRAKSMASIEQQKEEFEPIIHSESQMIITRELSSLSLDTDPFVSAKQIITSNIKLTHKYTINELELLKQFGQNLEAYDAYITASGLTDESYYSYANNLKQSRKDLDSNYSLVYQINVGNDSLLKRINQMTSAYNKVTQKLEELESETENQNIALQKEILDSISSNELSSNLEKLHNLESSLELLENLGLINEDLITQKEQILEEIKTAQEKITKNEENVPQEEIDKLIIKTQDFIGGIKTIKSRPSSPTIDTENEENEEQMKKDLSRIRRQRDSLKRHLNTEKQKTDELKQQIISLNNKIETERENYNSDLLAYKAQVDALKSTLSTDGQSAIDLLKQQLINMQNLAESARHERDLFKSKLDDLEEALLNKEETIDKLNQQIETMLQNQEMELMTQKNKKKSKEEEDYNVTKEVKKLNEELQKEQAKQMESMMAENKRLTEECNNLNQKIIKIKQKLRTVKEANADMNLRIALGVDPKNAKRTDEATQHPPESFANFDDDDRSLISSKSYKTNKNKNKNKQSQIKLTPSQILRNEQENKNLNDRENQKDNEKQNEIMNDNDENDKLNNTENDEQNELNENQQNDEEEQDLDDENQNLTDNQEYDQNSADNYDTFDSYEELDTVGDILLKMPDDKSDEMKYEFGDIAPRVHDPIYLPRKKKKNKMILKSTEIKTQKNNKRIQPAPIHHSAIPESKLKEREEDLKNLTINNQPQGKRYLTGTTQPVKPTVSLLHSNGTRNSLPMLDKDGKAIEVGNEEKMPIVESSFILPTFNNEDLVINKPKPSLSKESLKNMSKTTTYVIDKSLQNNPIAPLRITLVVHDKDKEKEKKLLNNNGVVVIPKVAESTLKRLVTPLSNYSKGQPPIVGRPIEKAPQMTEAQKMINKLRESKRKLQASNDQKDIEIVTLKQKLSELTLALHRLKLDNIKKQDDFKRLSIRYDYVQNRLEIRTTELAHRDEEIQKLKRELVVLRMQVQPVNQQLAKLKNAQRERDRLKREQERRNQLAIATKNALGAKSNNDSTKRHLEVILENQRASIARLETQRKMWLEIERNHMMGVLSAMSLLSTSQYKVVKNVLPSYSPFSSSKVKTLKQVLQMNNKPSDYVNYKSSNFGPKKLADEVLFDEDYRKSGLKNDTTFSYADKLNAIDRIEPPLSKEEKELVILQKETPEIEQKIVTLLKGERDKNTMSKVTIDVNNAGFNS